jgi:catalase
MAKSPKGSNAASATIHDQELSRGAGGELHQFAKGEPRC